MTPRAASKKRRKMPWATISVAIPSSSASEAYLIRSKEETAQRMKIRPIGMLTKSIVYREWRAQNMTRSRWTSNGTALKRSTLGVWPFEARSATRSKETHAILLAFKSKEAKMRAAPMRVDPISAAYRRASSSAACGVAVPVSSYSQPAGRLANAQPPSIRVEPAGPSQTELPLRNRPLAAHRPDSGPG